MKATELRIGNYINTDDKISTIRGVYHDGRISTSIYEGGDLVEFIEPIPLTEEWFLKFGFKKYNMEDYDFHLENVHLECFGTKLPIEQRDYRFRSHGNEIIIKYVHQLQNLYFALTGGELKINP